MVETDDSSVFVFEIIDPSEDTTTDANEFLALGFCFASFAAGSTGGAFFLSESRMLMADRLLEIGSEISARSDDLGEFVHNAEIGAGGLQAHLTHICLQLRQESVRIDTLRHVTGDRSMGLEVAVFRQLDLRAERDGDAVPRFDRHGTLDE
jgi:hypothetical protein